MLKLSEVHACHRLAAQGPAGTDLSRRPGLRGTGRGRYRVAFPAAFDHLLFTGATSIGKHVMRAAAET
jgi:hypothetical protein